jgi:hypothetical protein
VRLQRRKRSRKGRLVAAGFVGGLIAGVVVWSLQMKRSRRDLFSTNALKRYAALGYLGGHPSVETAQLLTEYLRWESKPVLRRKAQRLLQRMEGGLV